MNLKEFAALKVGDRVRNDMAAGAGLAEVVEVTDSGVRIRWLGSETRFFYPVNSTAWMHWSKVEQLDNVHHIYPQCPDCRLHHAPNCCGLNGAG